MTAAVLSHRSILAVDGDDRASFLQGLISVDTVKLAAGQGRYAALLTPQGKFLYDLFVVALPDRILLEVETAGREALLKKLTLHRLRAKVTLSLLPDLQVWGVAGAAADAVAAALGVGEGAGAAVLREDGGVILRDPRLPDAGLRLWLPVVGAAETVRQAGLSPAEDLSDWDQSRIGLGVPDGSRDMVPEKALLLENGFDELRGVDWDKGCYMGQELTARTKYRALIRKRLLPVHIDGQAPQAGQVVLTAAGAEAGEMRSSCGAVGLALLRLEAVETGGGLHCGDATLTPQIPGWMRLPSLTPPA